MNVHRAQVPFGQNLHQRPAVKLSPARGQCRQDDPHTRHRGRERAFQGRYSQPAFKADRSRRSIFAERPIGDTLRTDNDRMVSQIGGCAQRRSLLQIARGSSKRSWPTD